MKRQPKPAELVIVISGVVALIGSFLPFWKAGPFSTSAWGDVFPLATYVPIFGVAMALIVGLPLVSDVKIPESVLGFSKAQLVLVLGIFSVLIMFGFLMLDNPGTGSGHVLLMLSSIGLVVGGVMHAREHQTL